MKVSYVKTGSSEVLRGTVTSMSGRTGVVLFDAGAGSAYFNMIDGCRAGVCKTREGLFIEFSTAIDVKRPDPHLYIQNPRRRIVVIPNRLKSDWAYVWAYEGEYDEACADIIEICAEEEERQREQEREFERMERAEQKKEAARATIDALGFFRIMQAHTFTKANGQSEARPARPAAGPMKLSKLLSDILSRKAYYVPSQPRGTNDILTMWFERAIEGGWERVRVSHDDIIAVMEVYDGGKTIEHIQPFLDCLAAKEPQLVVMA